MRFGGFESAVAVLGVGMAHAANCSTPEALTTLQSAACRVH